MPRLLRAVNVRFHVNCNCVRQTYVGSVVVSVNPYRNLAIYDEHQVARYRGEDVWGLCG